MQHRRKRRRRTQRSPRRSPRDVTPPLPPTPPQYRHYLRYDLDILRTAYTVNAIVKKRPRLPMEEAPYSVIIHYILTYITAGRKHFDGVLVDAQRARNIDRAKGVHWSLREVIPDSDDIFQWRAVEHSPPSRSVKDFIQ